MNPYLLFGLALLILNVIDHANTRDGLIFRRKAANPIEIHRYLNYLREDLKDPTSAERNPISRYFFRRWGIEKGGTLCFIFWCVPVIIIYTYTTWKWEIPKMAIVAFLSFYLGALWHTILVVQSRKCEYLEYRKEKIRNEESAKTGEKTA